MDDSHACHWVGHFNLPRLDSDPDGAPLGATFPEAWDTVVWLGFGINLVVAEIWINVTRPGPIARGHVPAPKTALQTVEA